MQVDGFQVPSSHFFANIPHVEHDSTWDFDIDDSTFEASGAFLFDQKLDDHASIWRDDTPDSYALRSYVVWELPSPDCAVKVVCDIDALHQITFTNGADDGGTFLTEVRLFPSNERGEIPENAHGFSWPVLGDICNQALSGSYDGALNIGIEFFMPKKAVVRVALFHEVCLWAQDGLVEAKGTIGTTCPTVPYLPLLRFSMIPIS